uniref:Uncharacterized protein n=1 Tax=Lepeophtheirus salmonis TaxID=72036 RepID=A0A0K2TLZ1_LEPSM
MRTCTWNPKNPVHDDSGSERPQV